MMPAVYLHSVGLLASGLQSWPAAQPVLSGCDNWQAGPVEKYKPQLLPPNECRRATAVSRLVFKTCEEALGDLPEQQANQPMASVFASSGGDYQVIDNICRSLSLPRREVSPTQFHNSVHNAPAGYWSIATESRLPSTSLSAHDYSFTVGLIEAVLLCDENTVLFCCYDNMPDEPLLSARRITEPFAAAFILSSNPEGAIAELHLDYQAQSQRGDAEIEETLCKAKTLEALRCANPAARCLPLLELLAAPGNGQNTALYFAMPDGAYLQLTCITLA